MVNKFKANNSTYLLIPPGLTRYIQPLDVVVNKPIKNKMYNWDTNFRINNLNIKNPNEIDIIEAINDIWYNNNDITREMIIKSFKITGISVKVNGEENNLIRKIEFGDI